MQNQRGGCSKCGFPGQCCSRSAPNPRFQALHALGMLETPCFVAFSGLEALISAEPSAWMLKTRVSGHFLSKSAQNPRFQASQLKTRASRPFLQQIRSEPAFPGRPCSFEKLQAPFRIASMRFQATWAQTCSDAALQALGLQFAQSSGPGNRALAASTGGALGLLAMKRRQQAQAKPLNRAQAASTGGTLGLLAMKRRQQAQVKPLAAPGTRESRTGSQHRWNLWPRG